MSVALNSVLVLLAALLGIVTNYATDGGHEPFLLGLLRSVAVPAIGVLIVALLVVTVMSSRLESVPPPSREWDPTRTPYPGLEPFGEDEAAVFFGREEQITSLVGALNERDGKRYLVLVGASGSGKSSLVQAGLVPRLRARRWIVPAVVTPASDPMAAIARALDCDVTGIRDAPGSFAAAVDRLRVRSGRRHGRVLLVVDQAEELFTLSGQHERELFLGAIEDAVQADPRLSVLLTVRIDFLASFLETSHAARFAHPMALGSLLSADLATVIEAPGTLVGLTFDPGLISRISADTGTSDALPLLAYLLQELYFAAGRRKQATFEDYARLGGVAGALSRHADLLVAEIEGTHGHAAILGLLLRLVAVDGGEAVRRRVPLQDLTDVEREIIEAFIDARLVVSFAVEGTPFVQVAHEALFRQWVPLRLEVEAQAERLRQRTELERWAADWDRADRKPDYLLTGERLQLALRWLEDQDEQSGLAAEFVETSRGRDSAYLRQVSESIGEFALATAERDPEPALLLTLAALREVPPTPAAVEGLMTALAFDAQVQTLEEHADAVRSVAWSPDGRRLATASEDRTAMIWNAETGTCDFVLPGHEGIVYTVQWSPDGSRIATACRDGFLRVWDSSDGRLLTELLVIAQGLRCVDWSSDGSHLVVGGWDSTALVYETTEFEPVARLDGHARGVLAARFAPDGHRLVTCARDLIVRVWDWAGGEYQTIEQPPEEFVQSVAWSPAGTEILTISGEGTVRLWSADDLSQVMEFHDPADRAMQAAWSPDATYLAYAGGGNSAWIRDPRTGRELLALRGHRGEVTAVSWAPGGALLATASRDGTARIWNSAPAGAEQLLLTGSGSPVLDVAHQGRSPSAGLSRTRLYGRPELLPQRQLCVSASEDRSLRIWDLDDGTLKQVLDGHDGPVAHVTWRYSLRSAAQGMAYAWTRRAERDFTLVRRLGVGAFTAVAWSADERIATAGTDNVIRLWNAVTGELIGELAGHEDRIVALVWSSGGMFLASASKDRSARIWDMFGLRQIAVLPGRTDTVAWSPDDGQLATCSPDGSLRIWSVIERAQVASLAGHTGRIAAASWSPDGSLIATASHDRTLRLWDARTHQALGVVGVHRDRITCLAWTHEGTHLLTGSRDGTTRLWRAELDLDALILSAATRARRPLTPEERRTHLLQAE